MKRFHGSAIFEGTEVSNSDFELLTELRQLEQDEIDFILSDFADDLDALQDDLDDDCSDIVDWTTAEIHYLNIQLREDIADVRDNAPFSAQESLIDQLVAQFEREEAEYLEEMDDDLDWYYDQFDDEVYDLEKWRDNKIDDIREQVSEEINGILAAIYFLPVYMLVNKPGACDVCAAKDRTTGTIAMLRKRNCVPLIHINCRCTLVPVGYIVMSGSIDFKVSEALRAAAAAAGVPYESLIPALPPRTYPSGGREDWEKAVADWWAFWDYYYPYT
jgi:hypothetical protein